MSTTFNRFVYFDQLLNGYSSLEVNLLKPIAAKLCGTHESGVRLPLEMVEKILREIQPRSIAGSIILCDDREVSRSLRNYVGFESVVLIDSLDIILKGVYSGQYEGEEFLNAFVLVLREFADLLVIDDRHAPIYNLIVNMISETKLQINRVFVFYLCENLGSEFVDMLISILRTLTLQYSGSKELLKRVQVFSTSVNLCKLRVDIDSLIARAEVSAFRDANRNLMFHVETNRYGHGDLSDIELSDNN